MDTSKLKVNFLSLPKLPGRASRLALVFLFVLLVCVGAIPGYLSGNWLWSDLPQVANLQQIRSLRTTGLSLPGWETAEQAEVNLGSHKWSAQLLEGDRKQAVLLILPQNYYQDQPEVEWMDIQGAERWKSDSYGKLSFTVKAGKSASKVKARWFRAWNQRQTFAVVQWYAWPGGGHFAPGQWFWLDQFAQLRQRRVPWVAICLKIPIEPLGDLEAAEPLARALAEEVQAALVGPFQGQSQPVSFLSVIES